MRRERRGDFELFICFSLMCDNVFFLRCILYILGQQQILDVVVFPPYFPFPQEKEGVEAVSVGAILSDYQRVRVENV